MTKTVKDKILIVPLYLKTVLITIGIFAVFAILYIAQSILIPLVFALIIAIVLHPVVNWLIQKKINRVVAIVIVLSITVIFIAAFSSLIFRQVIRFSESWPVLVDKSTAMINQTIADAAIFFDVRPKKIHVWIAVTKEELINKSSVAIGQTLVILGNALVVLFLIPVYVFMILFYQPLLREFIQRLFSESNKAKVSKIVSQIKVVIQRYLIGLIIEFVLVAILNIAALLMLGIEYAILLGILGALLNIIPYIGGIISVALFMLVAFVTKSPVHVLYVVVAYSLIQLIDNNYIIPKIVASKVKINALFSVIVVIAGNMLWGIPGMFLSIPILAIVKLVFDHIDSLKPWGFLLGDTMPPLIKIAPIFKKLKLKKTIPEHAENV
ncbi:MAG: AI-2E family transporter [Bacteroidales bacterium]|jgi:predicted PurR-regulated permease PerM|nr:AI-2E family transporter [Bacteroidales bacterium]